MRVAFDASSMRGNKTGIGIYTENLIRNLREVAPQIEIVELDDGVTTSQRVPFRIWRELVMLPRLARPAQADVLHLTGYAVPPSRPARGIVMTLHDVSVTLFPGNFTRMARLYWGRWLPFTSRFADMIITDSTHSRRDIIRLLHIPEERILSIPLGVDPRHFHPATPGMVVECLTRYSLPETFILYVGTIEYKKGTDTLIDAFAHLAPSVSEDLVIVGTSIWHGEPILRRIGELGLTRRVHIIPPVPDADLPLIYAAARTFVFPCRYEGFGLPVLEAMACGTPVVCADSAALPEVAGDAAIMVAPGDADGLAQAIQQVLDSNELVEGLRLRGFENVRAFSWARTARATLAVYEQVAARARLGSKPAS